MRYDDETLFCVYLGFKSISAAGTTAFQSGGCAWRTFIYSENSYSGLSGQCGMHSMLIKDARKCQNQNIYPLIYRQAKFLDMSQQKRNRSAEPAPCEHSISSRTWTGSNGHYSREMCGDCGKLLQRFKTPHRDQNDSEPQHGDGISV